MARLLHHLHHAVVAHHVRAVGERGVDVGVERPGGGYGVAFDAGHLHQTAHGVAREAQVVFERHFRRILDLRRGASEELACCGRSHGAGHAHLALAAHLGARDGRIGLGHVAEESRRGQGPQDADAQEIARGGQVVEHGRHHAARSARGGRHDRAARGILLGRGEGVGIDARPRTERVVVTLRLDHVGAGLARDLQAAGQHAVVVQSPPDRVAHRGPDRVEVVPDFGSFAVVHVFPVGFALAVAPILDFGDGGHAVDPFRAGDARAFVGQRSAAYAVHGPSVDRLALLQPFEQHAVGVERQRNVGAPHDFGRGQGREHREDGRVGEVSLARCGERAVERHAVGVGQRGVRREEFGGFLGSHRVAARRSRAYLVEFFERFHAVCGVCGMRSVSGHFLCRISGCGGAAAAAVRPGRVRAR